MGPENKEDLLKGWKPMSCKGQVQQIKALLKNQSMLSEDQKNKLVKGKDNSPVEAPQASTSAKKGKANPKEQSEGQAKGKAHVEQALPTQIPNSQEREDRHGKCVQYGKNSDGVQKQGGGKNEPILSKEMDLVKLVNHFGACNKDILAKLNKSEYIQKKLGREILQVKETQNTIIGFKILIKTIFYI
ncbi:hypothetical protein O181_001742 [Austropuccinia psidii MF-1]|uniref:Uncharacterized protein n=1 Tax=Austropuccinia psidii MF-1 TaxID=1389203 RepID=A0A9Q3GDC6_9BASI|nr:hypothetical protein [Austropuccinia psidii MF-1]